MESPTDETALMTVTSSQPLPEAITVELCTNGDATLVVEPKRFVVSSEILKISSEYFKALFSPIFQEGKAIQNRDNPEIVLHDDDPEVMELILSILHYRFQDNFHHFEPHMILQVAQHSDKYQCNKPLTPWITQWLQNIPTGGSVSDYDCLLTAAYVFGAEQHLKAISVAAIRNLPLDFGCESTDTLQLPDPMRAKIMNQMKQTAERIRYQIESAHSKLRVTTTFYIMLNEPAVCHECDRIMPRGALKCHRCRNSNLQPRRCTNRTRSSDYLDFLVSVGLWPTAYAFRKLSVAQIAKKLSAANFNKSVARCSGGKECPLRVVLEDLSEAIQRIVDEEIEGLPVQS